MKEGHLEFGRVHDAFRPRIERYLTRLIGAHEAEDVTQEVFVKVGQGLPTFRGECALSTWIYRIATNAAIDRMRTASFRQAAQTGSLDDPDEDEDAEIWIGENTPSVEQRLMRKERYECFGNFIENLPPNYRTIVALSELGDLSNAEIAGILGLSLDVVKIRLHRGKARLLEELRAYCKAEDWL